MKTILQKELGLPVVEIADEQATVDGGDVLFTGKSLPRNYKSNTRKGEEKDFGETFQWLIIKEKERNINERRHEVCFS